MKIAAFLGVKDEIELIGEAIAHLRRIGVDHIIACDSRSTDGSAEVLAEAARNGSVEILDFDDVHAGATQEAALLADVIARARAARADWLLYCDADEFWLPATGSLRDCPLLSAPIDLVRVPRCNVVLMADGPRITFPATPDRYDDILLFTAPESPQESQARLRGAMEARWISGSVARKLILRPDRVATTLPGGHQVVTQDGADLVHRQAPDIVIAHVPLSTEARFARKVRNIAAVHAATGAEWGADMAWHWRRWLDNVEREGTLAEILRNRISEAELVTFRAAGIVKPVRERLARSPVRSPASSPGPGRRKSPA